MSKNREGIRGFCIVLFLAYLLLLAYLLFFSSAYGRTAEMGYRYNLHPFLEIRRGLENIETVGGNYVLVNIVGNVAAFVPFGFLLPLVCERKVTLYRAVMWSFLATLTAESLQLISKTGAFDVDDLILNTVGGVLGYWMYCIWKGRRKK